MKIKVKVNYPWSGIPEDYCNIEISNPATEDELSGIAFDAALDLIFNRGIEWDYEIID